MTAAVEKAPTTPEAQTEALEVIARDVEPWATPDDVPFVTFRVEDHDEHWPTASKRFRIWLSHQYYKKFDRTPVRNALDRTVESLNGPALFTNARRTAELRTAISSDGQTLYLDLANERWEVVEITADGWRVRSSSEISIRFRRTPAMLPLPTPTPGGQLKELREFLNLGSEDDFILTISWLLGALWPGAPYPILLLTGEQGSAKSTTAKFLRALVDPNKAPVRSIPKDDRNLMVAALNSHIVAFDNVSAMKPEISDALCQTATGAGYAARTLYADTDETVFEARRPILINGIGGFTDRNDLLDRSILLSLPAIGDDARRDEATLKSKFERARPGLLGALLDMVSMGLRRLPTMSSVSLPRMADFALRIMAAEEAAPWLAGAFRAALEANREMIDSMALDGDPVVETLLRWAKKASLPWEGTASELLGVLAPFRTGSEFGHPNWPKSARGLAGILRRASPNLRRTGLQLDFDKRRGGTGDRLIEISRAATATDQSVVASGDGRDDRDGGDGKSDTSSHAVSLPISFEKDRHTVTSSQQKESECAHIAPMLNWPFP